MSTLTVVGTQWGDEGKGKITDYFAKEADAVVRWAGGDNAGHTICFDNKKFSLSIVPSGIFNPKCVNVIGAGCVINLKKLISELRGLQQAGINIHNLKISQRAHLIMPYHMALDRAQETYRGSEAIGTTKKGIGPCYEDKVKRSGIQLGDLFNPNYFLKKLQTNTNFNNELFAKIYQTEQPQDAQLVFKQYMGYFEIIKHLITNTSQLINNMLAEKQQVLFEGAQGMMLDLHFGTYPFVTSSHPSPGSIPIDLGIPPSKIVNIIGVVKAYNSRVGNGVFISEISGAVEQKIRKDGHEYGTVTARPRRIGWLDIVALNYVCRTAGVNNLAIMLLDVLSGLQEVKLCVGYEFKGQAIDYIPHNLEEYKMCKPILITMPGWSEDITTVKSWKQLPTNAQDYLLKIQELTAIKIGLVSVGPNRKQTILIDGGINYDWTL